MAYEAQANRKEAQQHHGFKRHELNLHRKVVIRRAARAALVAYAYCRGRPYAKTEQVTGTYPNFTEASRLIRKYGGSGREAVDAHQVWQWVKGEVAAVAIAA